MFKTHQKILHAGGVEHYSISFQDRPLTYRQVVELWKSDNHFNDYFSRVLKDSSFTGFRWETPALNRQSLDNIFEFVLIDSPQLEQRPSDPLTYGEHFSQASPHKNIISFKNLGGDTTLIVPVPKNNNDIYGHLASFIRGASNDQTNELWRVVGGVIAAHISDRPVWLSTAGGGVAWLHIRIDSHPKYYSFKQYKSEIR